MQDKHITVEKLNQLNELDFESCKELSLNMIKSASHSNMKKTKVSHLINLIEKMQCKKDIITLMWNSYLSGQGLSVNGSKYQKFHGTI